MSPTASAGEHARPVRLGRGVADAGQQTLRRRLAELIDGARLEPVGPRRRELVDQRRHVVEIGLGAVGARHRERDPGEVARPEERVDLGRASTRTAPPPVRRPARAGGRGSVAAARTRARSSGRRPVPARRTRGRSGAPGGSTTSITSCGQRVGVELEHEVARERLEHVAHRSPGVRLGAGRRSARARRGHGRRRTGSTARSAGRRSTPAGRRSDRRPACRRSPVLHRDHGHARRRGGSRRARRSGRSTPRAAVERAAAGRAGSTRRADRGHCRAVVAPRRRARCRTWPRRGTRNGHRRASAAADRCPARSEHPVAHRGEVGDHPVHELDRGPQIGGEQLAGAVAVERSISTCVHASTIVSGSGAARRPRSTRRRASRLTCSIGCTSRWVATPCRSSTMRTVSTRNGASSVTSSTIVRSDDQPSRSRFGEQTRISVSPGCRIRADVQVGLGDGVQIVVVALGEIEVGQLVVAGGQEAGEQAIVGAAMRRRRAADARCRTLARRRAGS